MELGSRHVIVDSLTPCAADRYLSRETLRRDSKNESIGTRVENLISISASGRMRHDVIDGKIVVSDRAVGEAYRLDGSTRPFFASTTFRAIIADNWTTSSRSSLFSFRSVSSSSVVDWNFVLALMLSSRSCSGWTLAIADPPLLALQATNPPKTNLFQH